MSFLTTPSLALLGISSTAAQTPSPLPTSYRRFTINNNCNITVWPAILSFPAAPLPLDAPSGWEAPRHSSRTLYTPGAWNGLVWGRTGCHFEEDDPTGTCDTGGCDALNCTQVANGTVTFAQMALADVAASDEYNIDMTRGFNLPLEIATNSACPGIACAANLTTHCPGALRILNSKGTVVACSSSCAADLGNLDQNCCTGQYADACDSNDIDYYSYFHDQCPEATNSYNDTDTSTSFAQCYDGQNPDYVITFCPIPNASFLSDPTSNGSASSLTNFAPSESTSSGLASVPSPTAMVQSSSSAGRKLSASIITGIVLGAYAVLLAVALWAILHLRRRRRQRRLRDHDSVRPYVVLPGSAPETPVVGPAETPLAGPAEKRRQQHRAEAAASSPAPRVDLRELFESRELEDQLLRFIAERMDPAPASGAGEAETQRDPPDYRAL